MSKMNRNVSLLLAATLVVAIVLGGVFVYQAAAAQTVPQSTPQGQRTVSVTGTGSVSAKPDQATVSLGVSTDADKAADALSANSAQMQKLLDALKAMGIKPEDIQTQGINVSPRYDPSGKSEVTGYTAMNVVSVRVRDLGKVGDVVDAALAAGANSVQGLSFDVSDQAALLSQAREQAMANAKATASQLAGLAGARLGVVISISESGAVPGPVFYDKAAAGMGGAPVEPGLQTVQTTLQVTYLLTD